MLNSTSKERCLFTAYQRRAGFPSNTQSAVEIGVGLPSQIRIHVRICTLDFNTNSLLLTKEEFTFTPLDLPRIDFSLRCWTSHSQPQHNLTVWTSWISRFTSIQNPFKPIPDLRQTRRTLRNRKSQKRMGVRIRFRKSHKSNHQNIAKTPGDSVVFVFPTVSNSPDSGNSDLKSAKKPRSPNSIPRRVFRPNLQKPHHWQLWVSACPNLNKLVYLY